MENYKVFDDEEIVVYHNLRLFDSRKEIKEVKYVILIILNRPTLKDQLQDLIEISDYIICADGGANELYKHQGKT